MARVFLIDTDTASDDAVALIMALRAPDVHVAAITVVSGNVPLEQGTRNALYTAELCGSAVPVYAGEAQPLRREPSYARWFHGRDGLGNQGYPPPKRKAEAKHGVDATFRRYTRTGMPVRLMKSMDDSRGDDGDWSDCSVAQSREADSD